MNQLLFPTAYTEHSREAYRYAQKLAQYFEAGITLVHIYESPSQILSTSGGMWNEVESHDMQHFAENQWQEQLDKLKGFAAEMEAKQFRDIRLDYIVTDGEVVNELLQIQQQNRYDLIVMGLRRHNLKDRMFGNTTYSLIDHMNCPLLLIPPDVHYMGVDKIIYGTAFEFGSDKAIDHLLDWCLAFNASLHMVHVHQKENQLLAAQKMENLKENFKSEVSKKVMTFQLLEGEVTDAIQQYIEFTGGDILAIHKRKQGFWQRLTDGSLTKTLAEEVKVPLLVLKS